MSGISDPIRWRDLPHRAQLIVITLTRLSEPLVQTSLQSYMYYQLRWFSPTLPPSTIATQAGILHASFTFTQFLTAMLWGRLADSPRLGRKSILLIGLLGTLISSLGCAFATTFPQALAFRLLGGATNGNVGVLRTMVGEIVREKRFQTRAFLLLPMCFNVGVIIGPILGGLLADLSGSWPGVFGDVEFLNRYPYALPNLLSAWFVGSAAMGVWLFLEETLEELRGKGPDLGIRVGKTMSRFIRRFADRWRREREGYLPIPNSDDEETDTEELDVAADASAASPLKDTPGSTFASSSSSSSISEQPPVPRVLPPTTTVTTPRCPRYTQRLPLRRIFTPNVLLVLTSNFLVAFHVGTFNPLWVIFLSTPVYDPTHPPAALPDGPRLPFRFTGGLGLTPQSVGMAMGVIGCLGLPLQLLVYAPLVDRVGPLRSFRAAVWCFPVAYLLIPYLAVLPSDSAHPPPGPRGGIIIGLGILFVLVIQVLGRTFALPSQTVLVNRCSPHPSVLGTVHGLGQSVSSGARTVGPLFGGWLYGVGLEKGVVGGMWWGLSFVASVGVVAAGFVREGNGHEIWLEGDEEEE